MSATLILTSSSKVFCFCWLQIMLNFSLHILLRTGISTTFWLGSQFDYGWRWAKFSRGWKPHGSIRKTPTDKKRASLVRNSYKHFSVIMCKPGIVLPGGSEYTCRALRVRTPSVHCLVSRSICPNSWVLGMAFGLIVCRFRDLPIFVRDWNTIIIQNKKHITAVPTTTTTTHKKNYLFTFLCWHRQEVQV